MLLVEDDLTTSNALRLILTRRGCQVSVATTLVQGLRLIEADPSAVVLDLMLPDGDGIEILRHIRERSLDIKVAVTTAINDHARLAEVRKLRPERLLRKPIDLSDLLSGLGVA